MVILAYSALTAAVLLGHPLDTLDSYYYRLDPHNRWPAALPLVRDYVIAGQRGPSVIAVGLWTSWQSWRRRSLRPLLQFLVAIALLNVSVGAVKLAVGRLGPSATSHVHQVFDGGDIFPSGHTSNAVVTYGTVALNARRPRALVAWLAGALSLTIGLGTIFLETHWATDVLGGWLAGLAVLLALPTSTNLTARLMRRLAPRLARLC